MRVVVVGASGNAGTSLLEALAEAPGVESVVGIARRRPEAVFAKTTWVEADVERDDLTPHFRGADAVVHLAWRIQPSHDLASLWRTNVEGSTRVFRAAAEAGVPALVYASSVGLHEAARLPSLAPCGGPCARGPSEWPPCLAAVFVPRSSTLSRAIRVGRLSPTLSMGGPRLGFHGIPC